ncbi:MAG: transposase [Pseudacidovorax sp.]|nr:transposase [Pseudacidovorax sp.]
MSDGDVPISSNWVENQIRQIAVGRSNWSSPAACGQANAPRPM